MGNSTFAINTTTHGRAPVPSGVDLRRRINSAQTVNISYRESCRTTNQRKRRKLAAQMRCA